MGSRTILCAYELEKIIILKKSRTIYLFAKLQCHMVKLLIMCLLDMTQ